MSGKRRGDKRSRELSAIHAMAKHPLRLDRDTYVALLKRVTGVTSAADLDAEGRARVLDEMKRLAGEGVKKMRNTTPHTGDTLHVREELAAMISKVSAILAEQEKSWNYAHGVAKRMFKVHRVEWLTPQQLHKLVAALQMSANRRK